ncbi:MAG: type II secretion system protein N, partial [Gammaproteobacteria bacterium]
FVFLLIPAHIAQGFGAEGTVWNGRVRIINAGGQQLRNTEWNIALSRMLIGQLGIDFKTRWSGGFAEGFAATGITGKLVFKNTMASMDIGMLSQMMNIPQLGGQASLNLSEAVIVNNWPSTLNGELEIRNLTSSLIGSGSAELLGNVAVSFDGVTDEDGSLNGMLRDTGGPLELNGTLSLSPPSNYVVDAGVKARPQAGKNLQNSLQFIGQRDPDGRYPFSLAGSL